MLKRQQLTASPACFPRMELEPVLQVFSELGFTSFEIFTNWAQSSFDWKVEPEPYMQLGEAHGLRYTSLHLPAVSLEDRESMDESVRAAEFAQQLGAKVVIFKAKTIRDYIELAGVFLDRIETLSVTPVITNHTGTAITSLEDYKQVLEGIDDVRMKALLEVGHFHKAGVTWREAFDYLQDRIALVHIKELKGDECVEYGTGDIDFAGLFAALEQIRYEGQIVIEVEGKPVEETKAQLSKALRYFAAYFQ